MNKLVEAIEEQEELHYDELADHIMKCFHRAKQHRDNIGITDTIKDSLRRYRGKYDCEELAKFEGISHYVGLSAMISRSALSWLKDAYFNAQDRPWTLEPTPNPELPESLREELEEAIELRLMENLQEGGVLGAEPVANDTRSLITELKNTASTMAFEYAMESAKGMSTTIEDQLTEAKFRNVLEDFLLDICIYPFAVLKGPVVRNKKVPVWDKNEYKFKEEPRYYVDRVNPINFYFSPDSSNTQDGEFVIEIVEMTRARLNEAKKMKGYNKEAINLVIDEAEFKYSRQAELKVDDGDLTDLDGIGRTTTSTDGYIFDVYEYNGRISGEYILEFLEMTTESEEAKEDFDKVDTDTYWGHVDPYEDYEVTVQVCNGNVIMLRENAASPIPYRPYYTTSAYHVPGSPYGESVISVIADLEDELNTAVRARVYNMGMSSGPVVEADISRFQDNKTPDQITPWSVIPVQSDSMRVNNAKPALTFTDIPSRSGELTSVINDVWERAHMIAGIPPYMYGENAGAAPTLGAFSLQYAGATKIIKSIISNIDHDIIEELIGQMYAYNMTYHEDESIKADARVNVRGSAGLIAQEQRQARPLELLQALGPILAQMQPETALALANETLSESGYDPASLGMNSSNAEKEASNRLVGQNTQTPQTDGRSGNVQNIADGNNLPLPI